MLAGEGSVMTLSARAWGAPEEPPEPEEPEAPGGPAGPAGPCAPESPLGPVAPAAPFVPLVALGPLAPAGPVVPWAEVCARFKALSAVALAAEALVFAFVASFSALAICLLTGVALPKAGGTVKARMITPVM